MVNQNLPGQAIQEIKLDLPEDFDPDPGRYGDYYVFKEGLDSETGNWRKKLRYFAKLFADSFTYRNTTNSDNEFWKYPDGSRCTVNYRFPHLSWYSPPPGKTEYVAPTCPRGRCFTTEEAQARLRGLPTPPTTPQKVQKRKRNDDHNESDEPVDEEPRPSKRNCGAADSSNLEQLRPFKTLKDAEAKCMEVDVNFGLKQEESQPGPSTSRKAASISSAAEEATSNPEQPRPFKPIKVTKAKVKEEEVDESVNLKRNTRQCKAVSSTSTKMAATKATSVKREE